MQLIQLFDTKISKTVPYYAEMATFTVEQCRASYEAINEFYQIYTNRIQEVTNASKQMKNDVIGVMFQVTEDFLELAEKELYIPCPDNVKQNTPERIWNFFRALRNKNFAVLIYGFLDFSKHLIKKTKQFAQIYVEKYLLPIYVNVKATLIVSRELLFQILHEKLRQLKMAYRSHKDTITMLWNGDIKKQIAQKILQNFKTFKQLTFNIFGRGFEIKVSKRELVENFHSIMTFLTETLKEVRQRSFKTWENSRRSTLELYQSALERIREKKFEIKSEMGMIKARSILQWSALDVLDIYYNG